MPRFWATFFAGAVALSPDDPDARFRYLVPRRAPIRIENVPADVCQGPTNEWRVAAALWDLYEAHPDGGGPSLDPVRPAVVGAAPTRRPGGPSVRRSHRLAAYLPFLHPAGDRLTVDQSGMVQSQFDAVREQFYARLLAGLAADPDDGRLKALAGWVKST